MNTSLAIDAIDMLRELFVLVGSDGRCNFWNKALKEVTGYADDEIKAMAVTNLFPHDDSERVGGALHAIFNGGEPQRVETDLMTRDGRRIPYELSLAVVNDSKGKAVAVAGLGVDVTDRKRGEEALRNMVRETNARREEITALLESTRLVLERKDFLETGREILRLSRNLVGAAAGYLALFEDDESRLAVVDPESLREGLSLAGPMPVSALHGKDFVLGKAVIENDLSDSELADRLPPGHFAVKNIMLAPLIVQGQQLGLIGLANKPGGFSRGDSLMASAFGEVASLALQNARNLERLQESERRYREIFQNASEGIFQSAGDKFISVNPSFARMFGFSSPEELMSEVNDITDIYADAAERERIVKLVDELGRVRGVEVQGRQRDGEMIWCFLNSHAVLDEEGNTLYYEGTVRDITERKEAGEALRLSEAKYRAIVEDQTELITRYRPYGKVTFVNEAIARFFGLSHQQMIDLDSFTAVIPEDERERVNADLATMSADNPVVIIEHKVINGDGEIRWTRWINHGIYDGDGNLVEVQAVGRDITDRQEALKALKHSEEKYRLLIDTAPDIIYTIDAGGTLTDINEAFEAVTGFSRAEWVGKPFAPLVHPDDMQRAIETFELVRQGGSPEPYELRILTSGGSYRTGEFISKPLIRDGEPAGEFGVARDVSARKEAERALVESEQLYRALLATSPDAVAVTDLEFKVQMVSDKAIEQQRASSADELIGMKALDFIHPDEREFALSNASSTSDSGVSEPQDFLMTRLDGTTFTGEVIASVLRDADGVPKAYITTVRDITERKMAEHELQVLNNELEGYAHAVSHDLRGPLASISAAGETIQSLLTGDLDDDEIGGVREMSAIITNNVEKSTALIEGLLELAEAGQQPHDAAEVDVAEVVHGIVAERREAINSRRIKVHAHRDLGRIKASPTHMYQLFSNLIDNAIKHNTSKKPTIDVEYMGRDRAGGHQFVVRDNGPGIDPADAKSIFLPFVAGTGGKTGIGLATVEKIVGVYGGNIEVSNDGGARFDFVLFDVV
ncbi:MAG TPA: PAS domain S-box protein [Candidatus Anoxymicrobiaceae bacterium]